MSKTKKYLDFYIKSSLHVGLAVFSLVQLSFTQLNSYAFLVFFGTIVGYNFLKYSKWFEFKKVFDKNVKAILSVSLVASIACVFLFYRQEFFIQIHLLIALLLVVLYPSVRKIGWIKPFFVAIVVTFVTVYIPLMNHEEVIVISLQRFLLLSSVMIPFEISDSTTDSVALKTLPHWFGIQRTKQIGYALVVLFCVVSFHALDCLYPFFIYALSSVVAIYFSSVNRSWYYTLLWVESLPVFWLLFSLFD
jgi:hypothetical protein